MTTHATVIFQTLWTYDENSRISSRHGKHVLAKQCAKTNSARDVKNWIKTVRFPLVFLYFVLRSLQIAQYENSRDSATKRPKSFWTAKDKKRAALGHDRRTARV